MLLNYSWQLYYQYNNDRFVTLTISTDK